MRCLLPAMCCTHRLPNAAEQPLCVADDVTVGAAAIIQHTTCDAAHRVCQGQRGSQHTQRTLRAACLHAGFLRNLCSSAVKTPH
jgi:hypothetical protein